MATSQFQNPLDLKSTPHAILEMVELVVRLVRQDARTTMENSYRDGGWPSPVLAADGTLENCPLLSEIWRNAYNQAVWEIDDFFRAIAESEDQFTRFCQQHSEDERLSVNGS